MRVITVNAPPVTEQIKPVTHMHYGIIMLTANNIMFI